MVITLEFRPIARGAAIVLAGFAVWMVVSAGLGHMPAIAETAALPIALNVVGGLLGLLAPIYAGLQSAYMVDDNPKIHSALGAVLGAALVLGVMSAFVPDYLGVRGGVFWLVWAAMFGWLGGILQAVRSQRRGGRP